MTGAGPAPGEQVLRPARSNVVVLCVVFGLPMVLWWFTILKFGMARGNPLLSLLVGPALFLVGVLWLAGQRVVIRGDELVHVRWFGARTAIRREDVVSVDVGIRVDVRTRGGTRMRIPINLFSLESRRAIQRFLEASPAPAGTG